MLERWLSGWPSKRGLGGVLLVALAASAALGGILSSLDAHLQAAGHGIVALELAARPAAVDRILADWAEGGATDDAIRLIELDFAFLVAYAVLLAALTLWTARALTGSVRKLGFALVPACLAAGVFDVVENGLDLEMLHLGHGDPVLAPLGAAFAAAKFVILALSAAFLLPTLGLRAVRWLRSWTRSRVRSSIAP